MKNTNSTRIILLGLTISATLLAAGPTQAEECLSNQTKAKYTCVTRLRTEQACLEQKVFETTSAGFGRLDRIDCVRFSNPTQVWWIEAIDSEGQTFSGGDFPDGASAVDRLKHYVKTGMCN